MAMLKPVWTASASLTITATTLATSATRVAGRESTVVATSTIDDIVSGYVNVPASVTTGTYIDVWAYTAIDDTPSYPSLVTSGLTGSDADATAVSETVRNAAMKLAASVYVDSTTARRYPVPSFSIKDLFDDFKPQRWGIWLTHNTGLPLSSGSTSALFRYQGYNLEST